MMITDDLDEVDKAYADSLTPDDTILTGMMSVVTWIDKETGVPSYRFWINADFPVSQAMGYLEMAKAELLQRCFGGLPDTRPDCDDAP